MIKIKLLFLTDLINVQNMLKSLKVKNLAIIKDLEINFSEHLTTITGETGSGKSLIIGSLNLIRGQRFETSAMRDKNQKVIVEAIFDIKKYDLKEFFSQQDIDFFEETIIRREITPSGRSRAFINDTPVNLTTLKILTDKLIDIHSQYDNILLKDQNFQMQAIDAFSDNMDLLKRYQEVFHIYKTLLNEIDKLEQKNAEAKKQMDYYQFQFEQLEKAQLNDPQEQEKLEAEQKQLSHIMEIKEALQYIAEAINNDETGINEQLSKALSYAENISEYYPQAKDFASRLQSAIIELREIGNEAQIQNADMEYDPQRLDFINNRLNTIYELEYKFNVNSISELLKIKDELQEKLSEISSFETQIEQKREQLRNTIEKLEDLAEKLHKNRKNKSTDFQNLIIKILNKLGIENATFLVKLEKSENFTENGKDKIQFLFSANKNFAAQPLQKIASGGEISRVMLALKYIISRKKNLPTIIFDEIDIGISGKIAAQTGELIKDMAKNIQIIQITHSPQIAAKGDKHILVYKKETAEKTEVFIKTLSHQERIQEIAKMLSGKKITEYSLKAAKELLNL